MQGAGVLAGTACHGFDLELAARVFRLSWFAGGPAA